MKKFTEGERIVVKEDMSPNWLKGEYGYISYTSESGDFRLKDEEGHNTERFSSAEQSNLISVTELVINNQ